MAWLVILALSLAGFYLLIVLSLHLFPEPRPFNALQQFPKVAILIAVRNEEKYLTDCLSSLEKQTYPDEFYDVFVLNDRSDDQSPIIANNFVQKNKNFFLINIKKDEAGLKGKMNALAQGLKKLEHDIVLITDADCVVPATWIERTVHYFTPRVGLVGSFTCLYPFDDLRPTNVETHLFARIQALDWAFLQSMNFLNSNAGKPVSVLGNNFAFRLKAYREVGGFEKIGFSVTEDFALMEAIRKKTHWHIRHTIDPENAIYSHPLENLKNFVQQRLRWIKGGRKMRPWGYCITFFSVITHLIIIMNVILNLNIWFSYLPFIPLFMADFLVLQKPLKRLKLTKLFKDFFAFEIFYFFYLIFFSLRGLMPLTIEWKGRKH